MKKILKLLFDKTPLWLLFAGGLSYELLAVMTGHFYYVLLSVLLYYIAVKEIHKDDQRQ